MAFRIPLSCRPSFRIDVATGICLTLAGAFLGLGPAILRKALFAPPWVITILATVQTAVLVFSMAWAGASHGRRKIPLVCFGACAAGGLLIVTGLTPWLIQFLPSGRRPIFLGADAPVLLFLALASSVFLACSGFNALMTSICRDIFPVECRAQILARGSIPKTFAALAMGIVAAQVLDLLPNSWGWLLACGGLFFIAAGLVYRHMPNPVDEALPRGVNLRQAIRGLAPIALIALVRRKWSFIHFLFRWSFASARNFPYLIQFFITPRGLVSLMRKDRHYSRFQICQTLHGSSNLILTPAYILVMTDILKLSYLQYTMLMMVVPALVQFITVQRWAPHVDRLSPSRARIYSTPFWVAGMLIFPLAAWLHNLPLAYVSRIVSGIAMSGAGLMWTLGPLYYAEPHNATPYLAAHNFLTGTRGLVITLVGGLFYYWFGLWVFVIGAAMAIVAGILFFLQDRSERRDPSFHGVLPGPAEREEGLTVESPVR
jgi:MFS family permease